MKITSFRIFRRTGKGRFVWQPAIDIRKGSMICILNPTANG